MRKLVGKAAFLDREKASVYECGFEPLGPTRVSFSLRFFLIAVIFLVFDLEVVLLFPFVMGIRVGWDGILVFRTAIFLIILRVGLAHEHKEGSLD
ncbi:MAG: NADH dehydrogenase subunit 3 [Candidatus Thiodiazotropha endolucinida]